MNTRTSVLHDGQRTLCARSGEIASSRSQCRHWKCTIGAMKLLSLLLVLVVSAQAQSIADAARKEKERRAKLQPAQVITVDNSKVEAPTPKTEETKAADAKDADAKAATPDSTKAGTPALGKELPKTQAPPDPVKIWNDRVAAIRARIQSLQDQAIAIQLQQNEATNQVYAVITDPATQERAQAQLVQIQQQAGMIRASLEEEKRTLDAMLLAGPPKK
jgi:hypothetical protein